MRNKKASTTRGISSTRKRKSQNTRGIRLHKTCEARHHVRHEAREAQEYVKHEGTWGTRQVGTRACGNKARESQEHVGGHEACRAREHIRHEACEAREHVECEARSTRENVWHVISQTLTKQHYFIWMLLQLLFWKEIFQSNCGWYNVFFFLSLLAFHVIYSIKYLIY